MTFNDEVILTKDVNGNGTFLFIPPGNFNSIQFTAYEIRKEPVNLFVRFKLDLENETKTSTIPFAEFKEKYLLRGRPVDYIAGYNFWLSMCLQDSLGNYIELADNYKINFPAFKHSDLKFDYSNVEEFNFKLEYELSLQKKNSDVQKV